MPADVKKLPLPPERHLRLTSGAGSSVLLWLGLVVLFAVSFYLLEARDSHERTVLRAVMDAPGLVIGIFVAGVASVVFTRAFKGGRALSRAHAQAMAGDLEGTLAALEQAARWAEPPAYRATAVAWMGACELQRGRLERALSLFASAERSKALRGVPHWHNAMPGYIAACFALLGDVALARSWLELSEQRRKGAPAMAVLLPEVVALLREGNAGAALQALTHQWQAAEATGGRMLKAMRVLRAHALATLDAETNAAEVDLLLAGVHPLRQGELDFLAGHWPQMRDFLRERQLDSRPAA